MKASDHTVLFDLCLYLLWLTTQHCDQNIRTPWWMGISKRFWTVKAKLSGMVNEVYTVGLESGWVYVYMCVREIILAPWICGNQLGDIRLQSELMPTEYLSPDRSIRGKRVELWVWARPDRCKRCPCDSALQCSNWQPQRGCFYSGFIRRASGCPALPTGREKDLHAILFVFAFALASCEAHFMMLGEFMHLSCLRSSLWAQHVLFIFFWTYD